MAEQVLSQEEIDALLNAMDKGEVDLESEEGAAHEVKLYDLTSKNILLLEEFDALDEIYDKYLKLLINTTSDYLQRMIEVEKVSTETIKFGDFMQQFSHPTNFNIFSMEPLIGSGVIVFEPGLVFSLIDCMFGGDGKPLNTVREFTLIELRMIRKFVSEILNDLKSAWKIAIELNIKFIKDESKPEFVNIATPNDLMVVIVFAIKGGEFAGNMHLCIPYMMLEPIKSKLSSSYMREKARQHIFSAQIQSLLKGSNVTVVAELGRTVQTVRDILNFEIDDILKLNNGPDDPIKITVEDVPKFIGSPGVVKGNRAVQIINPIEKNGG